MSAAAFFKAHEKVLDGGLPVRRVLPAAARQSVGPFLFLDHFGPIDVEPHANHDVPPHPHIGLATVTYLYEGVSVHRDSVGSLQRVEPGAINWMTSGGGVVHSERLPPELQGQPRRIHGLQLWAALPQAHEEDAPSFAHTPAEAIPLVSLPGAEVRVLIGSAFGRTSPVATFSATYYLDIGLEAGGQIVLEDLPVEAAIYPVLGEIALDGEPLAQYTMAYLAPGEPVRVSAGAAARFVVIGGEPLDGRRHMFWNFVSSSKERLAKACEDWEQQRYAPVPGETEWIPLPRPYRP